MGKKFSRPALLKVLMVLAVCLFCICGHIQNESRKEAEIEKEAELEKILENLHEVEKKDEAENEEKNVELAEIADEEAVEEKITYTNPAIPDSDTIRESIYDYYGREDGEEISEEEVYAVKGKLSAYARTIHSGEEFALMREWYNWDHARYMRVVFSEDLSEWREEDLEALELLPGIVYVESSTETFPARALTYLTGAEELFFSVDTDLSDVTGTLPDGAQIPEQIKSVTLHDYREGKYETLLHTLEKSQVETIVVRRDNDVEPLQGFCLDDVAGIASLKELTLEYITIRVREMTSLSDCPLQQIEGYVDSDTDLGFVEKLAGLEEVSCGVLEEMDLSPFLEKKDLSLYLHFCRQVAEHEEPGYEDESYIVCPAFNRAVSWPGEPGDEKFPAIYQRWEDQGRVVECFTELYIDYQENKITNMWNFDPWIRVTDGSKVYELRVEEEDGFGGFRSDHMSLTDINFDGIKDIVLDSGGFGNQMLSLDFGWIWNRDSGMYEYSPSYNEIANASVDQEHQIVRSFWRNSAGSHSWAIYRYVDGAFVEQSELREDFLLPDEIPEGLDASDAPEVICWQEAIMENGEVVEIRNSYGIQRKGEEMVYPEIYESYYAEDSYWGGR
ncbi:MAG: hypothetical protein K2N43_06365 [Lachnospiraceae bacterium]|nr:hypothetical protein [Lachnospiraceae bacterium]